MTKKRLETLDAMRGIAVVAVMIYHYSMRYYQLYPQNIQLPFEFYNGKYGVQLFFIISGFVIFMSLNRIKKPLDFVVHRFIRLYPTFWFSVLFTFFIVLVFGLKDREVDFLKMILNLSMISGQFGLPNVDGVYWTLLYELKFYFWMFIIYISKNILKIENISLGYIFILSLLLIFNFNGTLLYKILNQIFIFNYMNYFISGIMLYKIFYNEQNFKTYLILFLSFLMGCYLNSYNNGYILFIIYGIFLLLSFHKLNWIAKKPFIFLGSISYALYLIHQNLGYIILNYTNLLHINIWIGTGIAIIISILIATFITFILEKNSMKYLKKTYNKMSK